MNTAIVVALLGTITTLITAVLVAWTTRKQSIAIEKLKARLDQESLEVNTVIAWLFAHDTDTINQYRVSAKEFLSAVQYAKDQLRDIAGTYYQRFPEERTQQLLEIRKMILTEYAKARFELEETPYGSDAHRIKAMISLVIGELLLPTDFDREFVKEKLIEISVCQLNLRAGIKKEIHELCSVIRSKVSNN